MIRICSICGQGYDLEEDSNSADLCTEWCLENVCPECWCGIYNTYSNTEKEE